MAASKMISLQTDDGNVFEVDPAILKEMQTVKSFIDTHPVMATTTIRLPKISSRDLARIIEYFQQHSMFCEAGTSTNTKDVKAFKAEFVKALSDNELKRLILATHYLNVKDLFDFLSETIANRIQNRSVESVRKFFGVVNDYTPEEEARLREENA